MTHLAKENTVLLFIFKNINFLPRVASSNITFSAASLKYIKNCSHPECDAHSVS